MANKITIQHYYTTGSTAPTSLELGEIAIAHSGGSEAIYIKNGVKFIPEAQIDKKFADAGIASNGVITGLSKQLTDHITDSGTTSNVGHVKLASGDLSSKNSVIDGEAAASYHTHGQYLTEITVDSGQLIASLIENGVDGSAYHLELTTGITRQINSGVSGYNRIEAHEPNSGTTANIGHVKLVGGDLSGNTGNTVNGEAAASHHIHSQYAENKDLTAHTSNDDIHLSELEKTAWDNAANSLNASANTWNTAADAINAFLKDAKLTGNTVDTLKEIQQFLDGTGSTVQTLLDNLSDLTDTVTVNTDNIANLSGDVTNLSGDITNLTSRVNNKVQEIEASDNLTATTKDIGSNKKYTIKHTTAGTQTSEIKATNTSTGLSFGSGFTIVNQIGYDVNGHVVSGSTQTLNLPSLPYGETNGTYGIVTLLGGDLDAIPDDIYAVGQAAKSTAAHFQHIHSGYATRAELVSNYATKADLGMTIENGITTISCGTY